MRLKWAYACFLHILTIFSYFRIALRLIEDRARPLLVISSLFGSNCFFLYEVGFISAFTQGVHNLSWTYEFLILQGRSSQFLLGLIRIVLDH